LKNYYHILGVEKNAPAEEIKTAFRKLSKKFHPDVNAGDAFFADRFKDIQEAYDTLADDDRRAEYDKKLYSFFNRGFDRDFLEGLKKRQEDKRRVEELKRKEEERQREEQFLREAQQAMELEEQNRLAAVRRRKRQKTLLWMVTILPVLVLAGLYFAKIIPQFKTAVETPKDTVAKAVLPDTTIIAQVDSSGVKKSPLAKDRKVRNLNGRWSGTVYLFEERLDRPIEFSCNYSRSRFQVSYPDDSCKGTWTLVKIDEDDFHFRETITDGEGSCIQGGFIVLSPYKRRQYHYSYYWPNDRTLAASGYITRR
jgi:ribosomal protein L20